ncbi:hypothetical protein PA598K_01711 [Paenibacillus sp. 598K]|uniref:AbrB/MazE/SpoVT family DNA-binding domain-containing protein n=1 Tax=Paenibacillus sp. 598K TaxID=1117987 RepID=UPI000FF9448E|nr:AbrB/MazE/SpoVT family DNA-binding domain-containing protein [Paenibacillus sp. 598K]GBF73422.1 hypothetical protein PA598K_01711 [Paenibacillus sp. 598K]
MKNTGVVRKVDELGRLVLPRELRRTLRIEEGDALEFLVDDKNRRIALRKYRMQECLFCMSLEQLSYYQGHFICNDCLLEVSQAVRQTTVQPYESREEQWQGPGSAPGPVPVRGKAITRLRAAMETYPNAKNSEWARLIGVTPGRVSQLLATLGKKEKRG